MVLMRQYVEEQVDEKQYAYDTSCISQEQLNCLNRLVGAATFDDTIKQRLFDCDKTLCEAYNLADTTWNDLEIILKQVKTLYELSNRLLNLQSQVLSH